MPSAPLATGGLFPVELWHEIWRHPAGWTVGPVGELECMPTIREVDPFVLAAAFLCGDAAPVMLTHGTGEPTRATMWRRGVQLPTRRVRKCPHCVGRDLLKYDIDMIYGGRFFAVALGKDPKGEWRYPCT